MAYIGDGYLVCDACGEYPEDGETLQSVGDPGASDSPDHCEFGDECMDAIDLGDYGLEPYAPLYGAETHKIGALTGEQLTDYGVDNLKEMLSEPDPTPYQKALHNFWREVFADYLQ